RRARMPGRLRRRDLLRPQPHRSRWAAPRWGAPSPRKARPRSGGSVVVVGVGAGARVRVERLLLIPARDGVLELAHAASERAAELGKLPGAEDEHEDDDE